MQKGKRIISLVIVFLLLFSTAAFAATPKTDGIMDVGALSLTVSGSTATCSCRVTYVGQSIDATLELWQGGTRIASWSKTGSNIVNFSETVSITNGLSYTLTVSGTHNGVGFTPKSITRVL